MQGWLASLSYQQGLVQSRLRKWIGWVVAQQPLRVDAVLRPARASARIFEAVFNLPFHYLSAFVLSVIGATTVVFSIYAMSFGFGFLGHLDIYSFTQFSWSMLVVWTVAHLVARCVVYLLFPTVAHLIEVFAHVPIEDSGLFNLTYWDIIKILAERLLKIEHAEDAFKLMGVIEKRVDGSAVVYALSFLLFAVLFCGVFYGAILIVSAVVIVVAVIGLVVSYLARVATAETADAASEKATSFLGSFRRFPFKGVPALIILLCVLTGLTKGCSVMNQPASMIWLSDGRSFSRVVVLNSEAGLFTYEAASKTVSLVPWHRISEMTVVSGAKGG